MFELQYDLIIQHVQEDLWHKTSAIKWIRAIFPIARVEQESVRQPAQILSRAVQGS
jgi:hypothetical protein